MSTAVWNHNSLACGRLIAKFAAGNSGGLRVAWDDEPSLERVFAVTTPSGPLPAATESYTRGEDRFSLHPTDEAFPFRTQLGWSATPCGESGVRLTLSVSLQTDLLDTRPDLSLATAAASRPIAGTEAWRLDAGPGATVIVAPHPSDAAETAAESRKDELRLTLSPPFLEKGVIRRCRLAAFWLPAEADEQAISTALAGFAESPLPLTA